MASFVPMVSIEAQDIHTDPLVIILRAIQPFTSITLRGVLLAKKQLSVKVQFFSKLEFLEAAPL